MWFNVHKSLNLRAAEETFFYKLKNYLKCSVVSLKMVIFNSEKKRDEGGNS